MNEEMWLPQIDPALCTGCGDCVAVCPTQALDMQGDGLAPEARGLAPEARGLAPEARWAVVAEPEACNYCAHCEAVCPVDAIALPYQIVWADESPDA